MIEIRKAQVKSIIKSDEFVQEISLVIDHPNKKAINYPKITGTLKVGDRVMVNTTACTLNLGTGGFHYIMANFNGEKHSLSGMGHGMKLKYTPNQINVLFSEEEKSSLHSKFYHELNLKGRLVFIAELHSMLMPLCGHIKYRLGRRARISCIITDYGALPVWMSKNIDILKSKGLLDRVISLGNAFGGDHECINIYTALQLSANILNSDAIIITMGPGIMGTGTPYGFSGLELGFYLDFCYIQGANVFYVPRISFSDMRHRHYGLSHHFINTLKILVNNRVPIVLPNMDSKKIRYLMSQLREADLVFKHPIIIRDGKKISNSLERYELKPTTMGRSFEEDPEFFYAQGAIVEHSLLYP
jgi:hypothetical protein